MKKIAIVAYEACWAMSVYLAKDFFRIVSLLEQHQNQPQSYDVKILSHDGGHVYSSSGAVITPEGTLDGTKYDIVIIPPIEGIQLTNMPASSQVITDWLSLQMKHRETQDLTSVSREGPTHSRHAPVPHAARCNVRW